VSEGHFNQGEAYYRAGEWSKARTKFQESYEISRLDLLLFNIAQTYIKEGDSVRAIAALKAYLKTTPSDADAQAKLASLEAALPQSAQAPPSQTQALPIPTRAPSASQTPRQTRKLLFLPLAIPLGMFQSTPLPTGRSDTESGHDSTCGLDVSIHAPPNRKERPTPTSKPMR